MIVIIIANNIVINLVNNTASTNAGIIVSNFNTSGHVPEALGHKYVQEFPRQS